MRQSKYRNNSKDYMVDQRCNHEGKRKSQKHFLDTCWKPPTTLSQLDNGIPKYIWVYALSNKTAISSAGQTRVNDVSKNATDGNNLQ